MSNKKINKESPEKYIGALYQDSSFIYFIVGFVDNNKETYCIYNIKDLWGCKYTVSCEEFICWVKTGFVTIL